MSDKAPTPVPRLTVITLGVSDMRASIAFYEALGFARKFRATGEAVAFFDTGATVIGCCRYVLEGLRPHVPPERLHVVYNGVEAPAPTWPRVRGGRKQDQGTPRLPGVFGTLERCGP